jgi:sodium/potassium/calcium exchanger 4
VFDRISVRVAPGAVTESYVPVDDRNDDDDDDDDDRSPFAPPSSLAAYPLWLLSLPWYAAFRVTCPDCSKPDGEKYYLASFFVSVFWISAISYGMVDAAAAVGCILGIPEVVMGTLVLAAGTSIPDALSSVSVAQSGQGDMAVANAVGSNVFDILLGLGLPWIVFLPSRGGFEVVSTKQLWPSIFILAGVLALYYSTVAGNKFKLVKSMGYAYLATYAAFVMYSLVAVWYLDVYDVHGK